MMQELEWGGAQQLLLLIRSAGLGVVLGIFLEVITGYSRYSSRVSRFLMDAIFGAVAALITFYCALLLTDGKLHPVMFLGIALGMVGEHIAVGKWISRLVRIIRKLTSEIQRWMKRVLMCLLRFLRKNWMVFKKIPQNVKKTRKKPHFFQKKS